MTGESKTAEKEAKKLEAAAEKISKAANKVGTLHKRLEGKAAHSKRSYENAKKRSDQLDAKLERVKNGVKYEAANVNVWRKVAKGDSCSDLIGQNVHEDPVVDYGGDEVSDAEAERAAKREEELQDKDKNKEPEAKTHKHAKHLTHKH